MDELSLEKRAVLKSLEEDTNVPVLEMSTITDFGVMEVKLEACERLLAFRVDQKIKTKKVVNLKNPLTLKNSTRTHDVRFVTITGGRAS